MKRSLSILVSFTIIFQFTFFIIVNGGQLKSTANKISRSTSVSDSMTFIGHATVKIKTADGMVIYIDPFQSGDYSDSANVVLVTHQHDDHNRTSMIKRKAGCQVITNSQALQNSVYNTFTIGNLVIKAVPAYNSNHSKNSCVGYVVEFNGIKIYHAGDTGFIPEMVDLAELNLDYALLPIDGIYNMTPEQAAIAADTMGVVFSIPIHTMPPTDTYDEAKVARFTPASKLVVHHGETIALVGQTATDIRGSIDIPVKFNLEQNYPNPFNPSTMISYSISKPDFVSLKVYDTLGNEVQTLVNQYQSANVYSVNFNAEKLSSGVYFYRLTADSYSIIKKLLLLK